VAQNIGFALKLRKMSREEIDRRVLEAADVLGLRPFLDRRPGQLSGGQRQRVAMGRAIVREPAVFLMDEPLSNLDAKLRVQMRAEVLRIQRRIGVGTLYVTHDQTEAMTMGDRVVVLRDGAVQQCDAPQNLYDRPTNLFVAAFIGSPAMNLFEAGLVPDASALTLGSQRLPLPPVIEAARPGLRKHAGHDVVVGIRPEHLRMAGEGEDGAVLGATVELVEALGSDLLVHFQIDAKAVAAEGIHEASAEGLDHGQLQVQGEGVARLDPRTLVRRGDRIRLAVDVDRLQLFDPLSGLAIWA